MTGQVFYTQECNSIGLERSINIACKEKEIEIALSENGIFITYNQGNKCYTIEYNPDFVIRSQNIVDGTFSTITDNGEYIVVRPYGQAELPDYGEDFEEMVLRT